MKNWLTTGEISKALNVATRTVTGWIDSGRMKGIRIPSISLNPRSKGDRRVYRDDFEAFCHQYGFRVNGEFRERPIVLTLGCEITDPEGLEVIAVSSVFEAGIAVERQRPDVIIVDWASIGRLEARQIVAGIASVKGCHPILMGVTDRSDIAEEIANTGFTIAMLPQIHGRHIIDLIRSQS